MIEKKISRTEKVQLKGLTIEGNSILDEDGVVVNINVIIERAFENGDIVDVVVSAKTDDTKEILVDDEE